jgi:hypothetical protein
MNSYQTAPNNNGPIMLAIIGGFVFGEFGKNKATREIAREFFRVGIKALANEAGLPPSDQITLLPPTSLVNFFVYPQAGLMRYHSRSRRLARPRRRR